MKKYLILTISLLSFAICQQNEVNNQAESSAYGMNGRIVGANNIQIQISESNDKIVYDHYDSDTETLDYGREGISQIIRQKVVTNSSTMVESEIDKNGRLIN